MKQCGSKSMHNYILGPFYKMTIGISLGQRKKERKNNTSVKKNLGLAVYRLLNVHHACLVPCGSVGRAWHMKYQGCGCDSHGGPMTMYALTTVSRSG